MSTFKMHPLHTEQMHLDLMAGRGVQGYHQFVAEKRCTGRSTAQALRYLADAIDNPNKCIEVEDHVNQCRGLGAKRVLTIDYELASLCGLFARMLNLRHIHIDGKVVLFQNREPVQPVLAPDFPTDLPQDKEGEISCSVKAGYSADLEVIRTLMRKHGWRSAYTVIGDKNHEGLDRIALSRQPGNQQE